MLVEQLFGGFGIDDLFVGAGPESPRPSSLTAIDLAVCGLALVTLDRDPPRHRPAAVLVPLLGLAVLATLVGYAYDVKYLRGSATTPGVALPTAVALGLAVTAIALCRPDRGIVAFLRGDDPASTLARRLVPLAILLPLLLGAVRIAAEDLGLFNEHVGLALTTLASILIVIAVIVVSVRGVRVESAGRDLSESSFRAVTEASIEGIVSMDRSGRVTYFNPAAERIFGHGSAELLGRPVTVLTPERFRPAHETDLRMFLETGERRLIGQTAELVGLRRDGTEFPISVSLVDWEADGRMYFTATIRDITRQQVADRARRELAAIVGGTADAVIGCDLDGVVTSWNPGAERIYGYSAEEMIGKPLDALVPPGERSELPELHERVGRGERIERLETTRVRKDGRRIDIALTVSPIRDEFGAVTGVSTIARDISEQKAAERRLAESARHFELINDLVATCGFDGYFKRLNDAWEPTLGWTPQQLFAEPFIEIVHPEDREAVEREVARLAQGETTAEFKLRARTGDGRWLWTEWSASPDVGAGLFYCVGREISERVESERVRAAERRQFADAQQIASVGSWELNLATGERIWSAQHYRNHGFEPAEAPPDFDRLVERLHPEDRDLDPRADGADPLRRARAQLLLPGRARRRPDSGDRGRGAPARRRRRLDAGARDEPRRDRRARRRAAQGRLLRPRLPRVADPADLDHRLRGAARRGRGREPVGAGAPLPRGRGAQLAPRAQPRGRPAATDADHRRHVRDRARQGRPHRARPDDAGGGAAGRPRRPASTSPSTRPDRWSWTATRTGSRRSSRTWSPTRSSSRPAAAAWRCGWSAPTARWRWRSPTPGSGSRRRTSDGSSIACTGRTRRSAATSRAPAWG